MTSVFTSIAPHLERTANGQDVTDAYLNECLSSWGGSGFHLVSLNHPSEHHDLHKRFPSVEFRDVEAKIPRIGDLLAAATNASSAIVGVANCDCILRTHPDQIGWMHEKAARGLLMMERLNLAPNPLRAPGRVSGGFDAFLFARAATDRIQRRNEFRIGETWWDYEFPLAFLEAGLPIATCTPLIHLDHPVAWDKEQWKRNAQRALDHYAKMLGHRGSGENEQDLEDFSNRCLATFQGQAIREETFAGRSFDAILDALASITGIQHGADERSRRLAVLEASLAARSMRNGRWLVAEFMNLASEQVARLGFAAAAKSLRNKATMIQDEEIKKRLPSGY